VLQDHDDDLVHDSEALARISWGVIAHPGDPHAFALIDAHGPNKAWSLVHESSLEALWRHCDSLTPGEGPSRAHLARWRTPQVSDRARAALTQQKRWGVQIITPQDSQWPAGLADLGPYQPPSLWVSGDGLSGDGLSDCWETQRSVVAVVGSRGASAWGLRSAGAVVSELARMGCGVVSGGALGIDTAVHQEALRGSMFQIAVLAGGLDVLYPAANRSVFARIRNQGALVSEAPCTVPNKPHRFLARNRLIAALSDALVVVEAGERSGAVNAAGHAAALGRNVGVVPGRWEDATSAGCWWIVRERAAVVLSEPGDVGMLLGCAKTVSPGREKHL